MFTKATSCSRLTRALFKPISTIRSGAQAKATADKTKADFERSILLLKDQVIAQADYDANIASYLEAAASLKAAEAALKLGSLMPALPRLPNVTECVSRPSLDS